MKPNVHALFILVIVILLFISWKLGVSDMQKKPNNSTQLSYPPVWVHSRWVCPRCRSSDKDEHLTMVTQDWGVFILCEKCWKELGTPQARLPYYRGVFDYNEQFGKQGEARWEDISNAVMLEK